MPRPVPSRHVTSVDQVDVAAFADLQECIFSGSFTVCEDVPPGAPGAQLINPLGPIPIDMAGPSG